MINKIENWLLNVALGKFVARAVLVIVAYVGGPVFQGLAQKVGLEIQIDPVKLQAQLMTGLLALFEWFKARRAANPNSVTVQTDPKLV
jgi:hypothetical protein